MGGLKKINIEKAIGSRIKPNQTILCRVAQVSYKGLAIGNEIEPRTLNPAIKQCVKNKVYHISAYKLNPR